MIFKNLMRRKGRTFLTILGIGIGVSAIVILGVLAEGIGGGYDSVITGSKADLMLSQPNTLEISMSGIEEDIGKMLLSMPEISEISGMTQGIVTADEMPYFFLWGYPEDSFILQRFAIIEGVDLFSHEAQTAHGTPIILGSGAAEALDKTIGDSVILTSTVYRIVGIFETGSAFEDNGGVIPLTEAQKLLGRQRQVNVYYIQLEDPSFQERVITRANRLWPDLQMTTTRELSDQQIMDDAMNAYTVILSGMAILIGGVGMANSQLMAVFERTREIGTLRSLGWSKSKVLKMILGETLVVSILGGILGIGLGALFISGTSKYLSAFGTSLKNINTPLLIEVGLTVILLGFVGGFYPARRASKLEPIEALRYEGGSSGGSSKRFPVGGMAVQSLWQRTTRTLLTLTMIALTISSIITIQAFAGGAIGMINGMATADGAEIFLRQSNLSDTSQSVIDQQDLSRLASLPEIDSVSGVVFTGVSMPETLFFIVFGHEPNNFSIQRFKIVEGSPLRTNHQIILGRTAAQALGKNPGDTIEIGSSRFKVVGIYETGVGWENMGGVVTLRDGQILAGRPNKVTMASVKLVDSDQAEATVEFINTKFPDIHATLSGEFAENMPDMQAMDAMMAGISFFAILVGGVGIMNTMLMAVLERTREIGTLRALGWKQRNILFMIIKEALLLGLLGGTLSIGLAYLMIAGIQNAPFYGDIMKISITLPIFTNAVISSITLGIIGGLYPAFRATRMQPVEALRYE